MEGARICRVYPHLPILLRRVRESSEMTSEEGQRVFASAQRASAVLTTYSVVQTTE